jgi:hypothetical protein
MLVFLLLGMIGAGCASLGARTEGTSGPLAWRVTDLQSEAVRGEVRGRYAFTLVLKESQGIPLTFTYRKDTIYASHLTVTESVDQAIHLRLRPYEERRFPLAFTWGCVEEPCIKPGTVAPMWYITLTGTDEHGKAVKTVMKIRLPLTPETSR